MHNKSCYLFDKMIPNTYENFKYWAAYCNQVISKMTEVIPLISTYVSRHNSYGI